MTGQNFYSKAPWKFWEEPPAFTRAIPGYSWNKVDQRFFSHKPAEKGFAPFLYHLGTSRSESSIISDGIIPVERERGDAHVKSSNQEMKAEQESDKPVPSLLCRPFDKSPDPKCKAYLQRKRHHDRLYVIDLVEALDEGLEFYLTENRSVSCYRTIPPEFIDKGQPLERLFLGRSHPSSPRCSDRSSSRNTIFKRLQRMHRRSNSGRESTSDVFVECSSCGKKIRERHRIWCLPTDIAVSQFQTNAIRRKGHDRSERRDRATHESSREKIHRSWCHKAQCFESPRW